MSNWTVHLEFEEGTSSKFWRARVEDRTLYVNYGKIGTQGQTQVKDFASPELATKEYDKLVREKRKKGYVDAGAGGGSGVDADDVNDDADDDEGDDDDDAPAVKPAKPAAAAAPVARVAPGRTAPGRPAGGTKLVLESGNRKVETYVYLEGASVRMDSTETYGSADAAKKAHDRLRKLLAAEGYKEG